MKKLIIPALILILVPALLVLGKFRPFSFPAGTLPFVKTTFLSPFSGTDLPSDLAVRMARVNISPDSLPLEAQDYLIASSSGILIYFPKDKDLSLTVKALQLVWQRVTMEQKRPKEIDLRFNKPVLRY